MYLARKETQKMKKFVEIDDKTLEALTNLAHIKGFSTVEELLTAFADGFSTGCSVTLQTTETSAA